MADVRKGKKPLGQHLLEKGLINDAQLRIALEEQRKTGLYLGEVFLNLRFVSEEDILKFFEDELNIPRVHLTEYTIDPLIVDLIPEKLARRYRLVPLFRIRSTLCVAMEDPLNVVGLEEVSAVAGLDIDPCVCSKEDISYGLKHFYGADNELEMFDKDTAGEDLVDVRVDDKIARFVENMVKQAAREGASDIHVEPDEGVLRIRFRVDGVMKESATQPTVILPAVVSRIKTLCHLDLTEKALPQEGRFQMTLKDRVLDLRVSTFPTINGENVVMQILDKRNAISTFTDLGVSDRNHAAITEMINRPSGLILVSGPAGSGKTSTLYAALQSINTLDRSIATLEDPIEYRLPFVRQTQINDDIGLTFSRGLRSLVRQDPDVIMVGEVRDGETARNVVRAAQTGHLVLSAVHTSDALAAVSRLVDLGVERYLVFSALAGVITQRLIRRICRRCRERYEAPDAVLSGLVPPPHGNEMWYRGKGCGHCRNTGYRGRVGVFEVLPVTEAMSVGMREDHALDRLRDAARREGLMSLGDDGLAKARDGVTTIEEVVRNTERDPGKRTRAESNEKTHTRC